MAYYGGLTNIFYQWESYGVFEILLPFLLIFAIVFGILSSTRIMGKNKAVYVIIAVAVGLMSLRWQYFLSDFLSQLFPRLGIGIAVILSLLILVGMFIAEEDTRYWSWGLASLGAVIFLIVIYQSFESSGYYFWGFAGTDSVGLIILGILLIGIIIAVATSGSKEHHDASKGKGVWLPWKDWKD